MKFTTAKTSSFNAARGEKPLKRLSSLPLPFTGLKPGANDNETHPNQAAFAGSFYFSLAPRFSGVFPWRKNNQAVSTAFHFYSRGSFSLAPGFSPVCVAGNDNSAVLTASHL